VDDRATTAPTILKTYMATDHHSQSAVDLAGLLALAPPPLVPINAKDLQHELDDHVEDEAHARQYGGRTIMPFVEPANYRICRWWCAPTCRDECVSRKCHTQ